MAMKFQAEEYQALDQGVYRAKLSGLEEQDGEYGPYVNWYFQITEEDFEGQAIRGNTSIPKSFNSATKMWQWAQGILGRAINPGENIDLESLVGRECMLTIGHKETERGTFARVDMVNPVRKKKRKPAPAPVQEEEYDDEDEDDLSQAPF